VTGRRRRPPLAAVAAACLVGAGASALAGPPFDLSWHSIDTGGGTCSGGGFTLVASVGQPDAGMMTGGGYTLAGGFLAGSTTPCPADTDGDGEVGVNDLLDVLAAWGSCAGCPADVNGDDAVDVADLLAVLAGWGPCP
jgi:hypothetical protein